MATTGFITGTGFYTLPQIENSRTEVITTPFGDVTIERADFAGQEVVFVARHGKHHTIAPADINYRANLYALHLQGVRRVFATSVSGSLVRAWTPGTLVLIDQFLNFTSGRKESFYPMNGKLAHVDVTDPYCGTLHGYLKESAQRLGQPLQVGATYACMNGPRYENRAEIDAIRRLGGQMVGHTNYPEVVLARELEICYATVGVVSNLAAGLASDRLTSKEVTENLANVGDRIAALFADVLRHHPGVDDCACQHVLEEAEL